MFFRLDLGDLAIGMGSFFVAGLAAPTVFSSASRGAAIAAAVGCGAVIYLGVAPLLYRALALRPMHFPRCPHCQAKEGPWGVPTGSTPTRSEDLVCGQCGEATTFVYAGTLANVEAAAKPAFLLRWPRQFGLWRRIR